MCLALPPTLRNEGWKLILGKGTDKVSVLGSGCALLPFLDWSGLASSAQLPGKHRLRRGRRTDTGSASSRPRLRGRPSSPRQACFRSVCAPSRACAFRA